MTLRISSVDLNPPTIEVLSTEQFPFTVEWADLIGKSSTGSAPVAYMYDNSNGINIPTGFTNNFGVNGTQAQYVIDGTKLMIGHDYTAILFISVSSQVFAQRVIVRVPY